MNLWSRFKILKIFIQLVLDPNRTDLIFKGVEIASKNPNFEPLKMVQDLVLSKSEFNSMYQQGYVPDMPALDKLRHLPHDSFGYAIYNHMSTNELGFETFPRIDYKNSIQYLSARIYQDHDLWHALLGYGIEIEDELAIQAFSIAQFQSPISTLIVAGGLFNLLRKDPVRAVAAFSKINEGFNRGKHAPFLLSYRIHDFFEKPLDEVRQICGVA